MPSASGAEIELGETKDLTLLPTETGRAAARGILLSPGVARHADKIKDIGGPHSARDLREMEHTLRKPHQPPPRGGLTAIALGYRRGRSCAALPVNRPRDRVPNTKHAIPAATSQDADWYSNRSHDSGGDSAGSSITRQLLGRRSAGSLQRPPVMTERGPLPLPGSDFIFGPSLVTVMTNCSRISVVEHFCTRRARGTSA